eukprot:6210853-Pleurochrysis_carterae.AAC.1
MASNPVTRRLAFNSVSPQLGTIRPGQVALHYIHFVIFAQRIHPTTYTLDDHIWVATSEEKWGVDLWSARVFTQACDPDFLAMTYLAESIRSILLQNKSNASSLDVSRAVEMLQLHQPANVHREARTNTVLITDTGARSYLNNANSAQLTAADVAAAQEDRVLSRIPRYARAGSRRGRTRVYFHWNPATTFVSAIEFQLAAMQGDDSYPFGYVQIRLSGYS